MRERREEWETNHGCLWVERSAGSSAILGLLLCASSVRTPCLWMVSYRRNLEDVSTAAGISPFVSWGSLAPQSGASVATGDASLEGVGGA